jgi:hypothetical protein
VVGAAAVLVAVAWLRLPSELYLGGVAAATAAAAFLAWRSGDGWARGAAGAFLLAATAFCAPAVSLQLALRARPAGEPSDSRRAGLERDATRALARATADAVDRARAAANEAVRRAAAGPPTAAATPQFAALERVLPARVRAEAGERAVAVFLGDTLVAWAGPWRVPPDALAPVPGVGVARSAFYLVLHVHARRGPWRAVAATLLHADPPGDTLAAPLDRELVRRFRLLGFVYDVGGAGPGPAAGSAAWSSLSPAVSPAALGVRALVAGTAEARVRATDEARRDAAPALLAMTLVWVAAVWRRGSPARRARVGAADRRGVGGAGRALLARRLAALGVAGAVVAVAPLNALSNASRAFDPAVYYSAVGGRFTASVGALALTGLLLVVGLFATLRAGVRLPLARRGADRGARVGRGGPVPSPRPVARDHPARGGIAGLALGGVAGSPVPRRGRATRGGRHRRPECAARGAGAVAAGRPRYWGGRGARGAAALDGARRLAAVVRGGVGRSGSRARADAPLGRAARRGRRRRGAR